MAAGTANAAPTARIALNQFLLRIEFLFPSATRLDDMSGVEVAGQLVPCINRAAGRSLPCRYRPESPPQRGRGGWESPARRGSKRRARGRAGDSRQWAPG